MGETDQATYQLHRLSLQTKKEARYQHAIKQEEVAIFRQRDQLVASIVKFENRHGKSIANLVRKRFLRIKEEGMEAKHPW